MQRLILPFLIVSSFFTTKVSAQFQQITQGPGYNQQVFFDLATSTSTAIEHEDWDIAFSVAPFSFAVFVNEGVISSQTTPALAVELYGSTATDFATADTTSITERLYNDEISWEAGAFNHLANPADPFDLGWGTYSPATQTAAGSRIFFIADRSGQYRKLEIQSLAGGTYTFRYADLDGGNEETVSLNKSDYLGKNLAYFSFDAGTQDLEPANWDLLFTRYTTPLDDGNGNILQYTVTGVLHNAEVDVAELTGVDPETVALPTATEAYSDQLDVIGYDWKTFDLGTFAWSIPEDLVYFVRDEEERVWQIQFIDFEGSSTGVTTFTVTDEGVVSATTELPGFATEASLFPNPASGQTNLSIELPRAATGQIDLINQLGQTVGAAGQDVELSSGNNQIAVDISGLSAGNYFLRLSVGNEILVRHLTVR
ncbi:hypothetical protein CEQ90_01065 [Lewinellaceae bacterium SD302]|nr:hypothetical protein CEQ90_01065 [Lewinellaceae bacterium SD302]